MKVRLRLGILMLLLLTAGAASALTPVVISLRTMTGSALDRTVTFQGLTGVLGYGTNVYTGVNTTVTPISGIVRANLAPGSYRIIFSGLAKAYDVFVPDSVDEINLADPQYARVGIVQYWYYFLTNGSGSGASLTNLAAGSNVVIWQNNGTNYVAAKTDTNVWLVLFRDASALTNHQSTAVTFDGIIQGPSGNYQIAPAGTAAFNGDVSGGSISVAGEKFVANSAQVLAPTLPATFNGLTNLALLPGRAMITDGNGADGISSVTATELGRLSGVTANVQSQFNALDGTKLLSGTVNSNALDAPTKAQLALAGTGGGGGASITNIIAGTNAEVHTTGGNVVISAITDTNRVNELAAAKASAATNPLGSAAYQATGAFQQALGYVPINKAADNGGNLTNINGANITNVAAITNIAESQVAGLLLDLAIRIMTNDTRALRLTNEANVFSGNIRLQAGTTNGIYAGAQTVPMISSDRVISYGNGAVFATASGALYRADGSLIFDPATGFGYYPDGTTMYSASKLFGPFNGDGKEISQIRGDNLNIIWSSGMSVSTNGSGQLVVTSISGGAGTVTSVGLSTGNTGFRVSPSTITDSGTFTINADGTPLTNGFSFSTTGSNNFKIDQNHSATFYSLILPSVGGTKLLMTDSSSNVVPVTIVGGTLSGTTLTINGGSGINSNMGSAYGLYLSNIVVTANSNSSVPITVTNLLTATAPLQRWLGTNGAWTAVTPGAGLHVGLTNEVGPSNLVVEGVFTGNGSNYFPGAVTITGPFSVNNGATNTFGPSIFSGALSNSFLSVGGNSNVVGTFDARNLTNYSTTNLVGNVNATNLFGNVNLSNAYGNINLTNTFGLLNGNNLNLTAGANITLTPSGTALVIGSSAAGGGLATINGTGTNETFYGVTQIGTNFASGGVGKFDGFGNYALYSANAGYYELDDANSNRVFSAAGSNFLAYLAMGLVQTNGYGATNYDGYALFTNKNTHAYWLRTTNGHIQVVDQWLGTNFTGTNGYWFLGTSNGNYVMASNGTWTVSGVQTNLGTVYGANQTNSGSIKAAEFIGDGSKLVNVSGGSGIGVLNGSGTNTTLYPSANTAIPLSIVMSTGNLTNALKVYGTNGSPSGFGPGGGIGVGQFATGPGNIDATNNITAGGTVTSTGGFSGPGASLTGLNGSQVTTGTVGDSRLSANVGFLNQNQAWSGSNYWGAASWFNSLVTHNTLVTNLGTVYGVAQTNSGNIQAQTINAVGDINSGAGFVGNSVKDTGLSDNKVVGSSNDGQKSLVSFSLSANFAAISSATIDTVQGIQTTSTPQFAGLGLGTPPEAATVLKAVGSNYFGGSMVVTNTLAVGTNSIDPTNIFQVGGPGNRNMVAVQTNGSLLVKVGQTNTANIQSATLNTTGNANVAGSLVVNSTITGNDVINGASLNIASEAFTVTSSQVLSTLPTTFANVTNKGLTASTLLSAGADQQEASIANNATAGLVLINKGSSTLPGWSSGLGVTNGENQAITVSNAWRLAATTGLENAGAVVVSNGVYQPLVVSSLPIPAGSWWTNNLATPASGLAPTNSGGWAFGNSTTQSIRFVSAMPANWDGGVVRWTFWGSSTGSNSVAGAGATNIVWRIKGAAIGAGDSYTNVTFGTAIFVTNHIGSPNVGYVTRPDTTADVTIGNTPTASKLVLWDLSRESGRPGDTATNGVYLADTALHYKYYLTNSFPTASP